MEVKLHLILQYQRLLEEPLHLLLKQDNNLKEPVPSVVGYGIGELEVKTKEERLRLVLYVSTISSSCYNRMPETLGSAPSWRCRTSGSQERCSHQSLQHSGAQLQVAKRANRAGSARASLQHTPVANQQPIGPVALQCTSGQQPIGPVALQCTSGQQPIGLGATRSLGALGALSRQSLQSLLSLQSLIGYQEHTLVALVRRRLQVSCLYSYSYFLQIGTLSVFNLIQHSCYTSNVQSPLY